jgi:hypothetical protein
LEGRGVARDADFLAMVRVSWLFGLARGVSPDLRIVLRARLSDSLSLGPLGDVSAIDLIGGIRADGDRTLCALDVHKSSVTACVRVPGEQHVEEFASTVGGLLALRVWLASFGVTHVAMEASGVCWKSPWAILEDEFECLLVNARNPLFRGGRPWWNPDMVAGERRRPPQSSSAVTHGRPPWKSGLAHHRPAQKQASRAPRSRRSARLLLHQSRRR